MVEFDKKVRIEATTSNGYVIAVDYCAGTPETTIGIKGGCLPDNLVEEVVMAVARIIDQAALTALATTIDPELLVVLDRRVDELEMSVRLANCLQFAGIDYIGELAQKTEREMLQVKNLGRVCLREIKEVLDAQNLMLGKKFPGWVRPDKRQTT